MGENLNQLEREVEVARAKLASDLSRLTSPATLDGFQSDVKREAYGVKDAMLNGAKATVQSKVQEVIDDLKARAAANPAAVLAIAAGIGWRLIHRPPVATALVGAGIWGLLRTPPMQTGGNPNFDYYAHGKERLQEQAGHVAEQVKERALELAYSAREQAAEFAHNAKEQAVDFAQVAKEQATEVAANVRERAEEWVSQAGAATEQMAMDVRREATSAGRQAAAHVAETVESISQRTSQIGRHATVTGRTAVEDLAGTVGSFGDRATEGPRAFAHQAQQALSDTEFRDKLLLGAAGMAVAAALSIAVQRRVQEAAAAD